MKDQIKFYSILIIIFCFASCSSNENSKIQQDLCLSESKKVKEILANMSIEEKIGQMTQINISVILNEGYQNKDGSINKDSLKAAILDFKVGSILNATPRAYSLEKWHEIITEIQNQALETPNKIPVLYGIDAIHGATFTKESTLFPQNIGIGATRNVELARQSAKVTANETRASGIRWNFDPVLDIGRNPVWARFPETYGEDPYLVKVMGVSTIKAYEEDGLNNETAVASCMKHFVGYSNPNSGKDRTPAYIPEIQLREFYLPQFKAAIDEGASTVMINSSEINGIPVHANKYLLTEVLRKELGFKGLVVSDWEDIIRLHTRHKIANTPKEAVKIAIDAGIDMSMVPHDYSFFRLLLELVNEKQVSIERINESVERILSLKLKLGLFENPFPEKKAIDNFGKSEYKEIALNIARESITLLKNDTIDGNPILPISRSAKILLAGPGARNISSLNGCWSFTWQGKDLNSYPSSYKNIYESLIAKTNNKNIICYSLPEYEAQENYDTKKLISSAKSVDLVILCLGEDAYAETPGTIFDLNLDARQLKLAKAAIETGKPVIVILAEGRPRIIREIVPGAKGIIQCYWPGSKGAEAVADVLFGDYNPSGKLPYTYPMYTNMLMTYDYKYTEVIEELSSGEIVEKGYRCQFPFGHGLSYSQFKYKNLVLSSDTISGKEFLTVTIQIENIGKFKGKEVIELYSRDHIASVTPSQKRLRAFQKTEVIPGETKTIVFQINREDLRFVNSELKSVIEEGYFDIIIGNKTAKFYYKEK